MEKSIEVIWKEGFLNARNIAAPKINNLYNQKSNHIIERMKRTFRRNMIGIVIAAFMSLAGFIIAGVYVAGILSFALLIGLVLHSRRQARQLERIDTGDNSYQYLKMVRDWLYEKIELYAKIHRFVYPALIATYYLGGLFIKPVYDKITQDAFMLYGLPVFWIGGIIVIALLFGIFAAPIYRYDVKIIYGRLFRKLDEILTDMEELRRI